MAQNGLYVLICQNYLLTQSLFYCCISDEHDAFETQVLDWTDLSWEGDPGETLAVADEDTSTGQGVYSLLTSQTHSADQFIQFFGHKV